MADHALAEIFQWNTPFEANIENIKSRDRWIDVRNYRKKYSHDNRGDDAAKITYELWLVERQKGRVVNHKRTDEANFQGEFNRVPGRREQPNKGPRTHEGIQYSNIPDLQKKSRRRTAQSGPTIESAKQQTSSNKVQNSNLTQYSHKLPTQNINLRFLGLKTKLLS